MATVDLKLLRSPITRAVTQTSPLRAAIPTPRLAVTPPTLSAASWYDPRDWFGGDDDKPDKPAKQPSTPIAGDGTQGAPYTPPTSSGKGKIAPVRVVQDQRPPYSQDVKIRNLNQILDPYKDTDPSQRGALTDLLRKLPSLVNGGGGSGSGGGGGSSSGSGYGGGYSMGYGGTGGGYAPSTPRIVASGPPTRTTPGGTPETFVNGRWVANAGPRTAPYGPINIAPGSNLNGPPAPAPGTPAPGTGQIIDDHGNIVENPTLIDDTPGSGGGVGAAPVIDWSDPSNPPIYQDGQPIVDPVTMQPLGGPMVTNPDGSRTMPLAGGQVMTIAPDSKTYTIYDPATGTTQQFDNRMLGIASSGPPPAPSLNAAADPANWLDSPIITGPAGYLETNPEVAYTRYLENQLGMQPDDNSLLAQWLRSQYDQSRAQYMAQLAADPNLLYQTFLNGFGDRTAWQNRFNSLTPFQRGVNRLSLQAPTRIIADNG